MRKIINDNIPAECPFSAIKVGETYPVAVPAAAMTALRQLADAPTTDGLVKMPGAKPSPFKNAGQQFLAAEMQRRVEKFATPAPNDAVNHGQTRITKLFDSPEAYRGILDQAWAELSKVVFSVRRDYRVDTLGNICTVSFEVGYTTVATSPLSEKGTRDHMSRCGVRSLRTIKSPQVTNEAKKSYLSALSRTRTESM